MKKEKENLFEEIMSETLFNLMKETFIQIQKTQRIPTKMNLKRLTPRRIIIKMSKVKERILKSTREKQRVNYKGTPIRLSADFFFLKFLPFMLSLHSQSSYM